MNNSRRLLTLGLFLLVVAGISVGTVYAVPLTIAAALCIFGSFDSFIGGIRE